ncbi:hypothetical protein CEXT_314271 [Caerostris extrusa]|uniref:Uncharacterized protein n=1 Tax=Caerostris extrusa TaxID=172846 RepID=A0AAV4XDU7_CAEEX|nr:hypothetical protein CEXT_314271 [Caerostris extrusa]
MCVLKRILSSGRPACNQFRNREIWEKSWALFRGGFYPAVTSSPIASVSTTTEPESPPEVKTETHHHHHHHHNHHQDSGPVSDHTTTNGNSNDESSRLDDEDTKKRESPSSNPGGPPSLDHPGGHKVKQRGDPGPTSPWNNSTN